MDDKNKIQLSTGIETLGENIQSMDQVPARVLLATSKPLYDFGIELTFARNQLKQMVNNFESGVLQRKVPVNFDHPRSRLASTKAGGWVTGVQMEESDDEIQVYGDIAWNESGKEALFKKEYLYTSLGAYINFIDRMDGKTEHGLTLYEVSLTNDPADVNLGAIAQFSAGQRLSKGEDMPELDELKKELSALKENSAQQVKELTSKLEESNKTLASSNKELAEAKEKLEKTERASELDKMIVANRITPAQKEKAMELSSAAYEGFKAAVPEEGNAVDKNPESGKNPPSDENKNPEDQVMELASSYAEANKVDIGEAVSAVLKDNPELAKQYEARS